MKIEVLFRNAKTNEQKKVKVGWSWTLFFFTTVYGIPLFLRGLKREGWIIFAFIAGVQLIKLLSTRPNETMMAIEFFLALGANIFFAIKGNELTARKLLADGWDFAEPLSDATRFGKLKWGLVDSVAKAE